MSQKEMEIPGTIQKVTAKSHDDQSRSISTSSLLQKSSKIPPERSVREK
jgi:hypothetical protein